jgi:uncharacterized protein related to proFAR isomerase
MLTISQINNILGAWGITKFEALHTRKQKRKSDGKLETIEDNTVYELKPIVKSLDINDIFNGFRNKKDVNFDEDFEEVKFLDEN